MLSHWFSQREYDHSLSTCVWVKLNKQCRIWSMRPRGHVWLGLLRTHSRIMIPTSLRFILFFLMNLLICNTIKFVYNFKLPSRLKQMQQLLDRRLLFAAVFFLTASNCWTLKGNVSYGRISRCAGIVKAPESFKLPVSTTYGLGLYFFIFFILKWNTV